MSATWKARVRPPGASGHQTVQLFVATEPDKWALGGEIVARVGDEADALLRRLSMPLEHPDGTPYQWSGEPTAEEPDRVVDLSLVIENLARLRHEATGSATTRDIVAPGDARRGASPVGLVTWDDAPEDWREEYRRQVRREVGLG